MRGLPEMSAADRAEREREVAREVLRYTAMPDETASVVVLGRKNRSTTLITAEGYAIERIALAIAAAREEGRREGMEEALRICEAHATEMAGRGDDEGNARAAEATCCAESIRARIGGA